MARRFIAILLDLAPLVHVDPSLSPLSLLSGSP